MEGWLVARLSAHQHHGEELARLIRSKANAIAEEARNEPTPAGSERILRLTMDLVTEMERLERRLAERELLAK